MEYANHGEDPPYEFDNAISSYNSFLNTYGDLFMLWCWCCSLNFLYYSLELVQLRCQSDAGKRLHKCLVGLESL